MKLIILDRDGVINEDSDAFIKSPEEWIPIPGSLEAIVRLNHAGYQVAVATNQSGLARGLFDQSTLQNIHKKFLHLLAEKGGEISMIHYCPHGPEDHCDCRKPRPGLLNIIGKKMQIDLDDVPVVGDSLRDLQSAMAAGCKPILVRTGKGEQTLASGGLPDNTLIFTDLSAVADALCETE